MLPAPPPPTGRRSTSLSSAPGQADLALGHHLSRRDANFLLFDAGREIGHSRRSRWESMRQPGSRAEMTTAHLPARRSSPLRPWSSRGRSQATLPA